MTAAGPRRLPSILPWLLASLAAHALVLVQWPQAGAPTMLADDDTGGSPLHVQLVRNTEPTQASPASVTRASAAAPTTPAPAKRVIATAARPTHTIARSARPQTLATQTMQTPAGAAHTVASATSAQTVAATTATAGGGSRASAGWPELMSLLHAAIDRHKRYPQSALSMGREGSTRVDFRLRPDGHIDDMNIGISSGVRALDQAAFHAVQAIAPFTHAGRYLDSEQRFQVDVVFRIN